MDITEDMLRKANEKLAPLGMQLVDTGREPDPSRTVAVPQELLDNFRNTLCTLLESCR